MLQIAFKFFQLNLLKKYNQSNELKQKKGKQNKNEMKINTMEKCKGKCKKEILKQNSKENKTRKKVHHKKL